MFLENIFVCVIFYFGIVMFISIRGNDNMELEQQAQIIGSIRSALQEIAGETLHVRANMGRSKIVECDGILSQVHPQLFIVEVKRKRGGSYRQSYQYVDVLTGVVELSKDGEVLFKDIIDEVSA